MFDGAVMFHRDCAYLAGKFSPQSWRQQRFLHVSFNMKSYHEEIEKFLHFISPYVDIFHGGIFQSEAMDKPVSVVFEDGHIKIRLDEDITNYFC